MRKIAVLLLSCTIAISIFAQAPQGIKYQAVARDTSGQLLVNRSIGVRISINQGGSLPGTTVYSESFAVSTDRFGLFNVVIGMGNTLSGNFITIDWSNGNYYVMVDIDASGGTNYTNVSSSQLMSVPYSLYAARAKTVDNGQTLSRSGVVETLSNSGGSFVSPDTVTLNYIISLQGIFPSQGGGSASYTQQILGEIRLFAGNFAPTGFAFCKGQLLSISTNNTLYQLLGTTYGGDGVNTFGLPDLRGAVPMQMR